MTEAIKKQLFIGLVLIIAAFGSALGIFYYMVDSQRQQRKEIDGLQDQLTYLDSEWEVSKRKVEDMQKELNETLTLENLVSGAQKIYGEEEQSRREGHLWIDRKAQTFIITLGALNGVGVGSRVAIYDENKKIGYLRVETAMDIISYAKPINLQLVDFVENHYRAVFED